MQVIMRAKAFLSVVWHVILTVIGVGPKLSALVITLDLINVGSRLLMLLSISAMTLAMQNNGVVAFKGFELVLPKNIFQIGLIGALAVGAFHILSIGTRYWSIVLARRLARRINALKVDQLIEAVERPIGQNFRTTFRETPSIIRLASQHSIHFGMMAETLTRMSNALLLFFIPFMLLIILYPVLAMSLVFVGLLVSPIALRLILIIKRNAADLYNEAAIDFGGVLSQHLRDFLSVGDNPGLAPSQFAGSHDRRSRRFFDALDLNILANEKINILAGLVSGLIIVMMIIYYSYQASEATFETAAVITMIGSFLYILASAQRIFAGLVDLTRFYPQARDVRDFLKLSEISERDITPIPEKIDIVCYYPELSKTLVADGMRIGIYTPHTLDRFGVVDILTSLTNLNTARDMAPHVRFLSSAFRFRSGLTVWDNLTGGHEIYRERAVKIVKDLGALDELLALPQGLDTIMSEAGYTLLKAAGRLALRLVPMVIDDMPAIYLIDFKTIQMFNPARFDSIFSVFPGGYIFVTIDDATFPKGMSDRYILTDGYQPMAIGDEDWFRLNIPNTPQPTMANRSTGVELL